MKIYTNLVLSIFIPFLVQGQDPHFSQFFTSPISVNPSLSGTGISKWKIMSNYRTQWSNTGTPFNTFTINGDYKVLGDDDNNNILAVGLQFMNDKTLSGAFESNYLSTAISYHVNINNTSQIGVGFMGTYSTRSLGNSNFTFGEQFTSGGFDPSLPSGEPQNFAIKPFYSLSSGIVYVFENDNMRIQAGSSMYHVNRPSQSFFDNQDNNLPIRYAFHSSIENQLSNGGSLNSNFIYQHQGRVEYFALGSAFGLDISNDDKPKSLYLGAWYRTGDAFYPYIGLLIGSLQFGLTYDLSVVKQFSAQSLPGSFELSFVFRNSKKRYGIVPCPWR
jgi:type IX secretion system PorP/SprF family membrane protein